MSVPPTINGDSIHDTFQAWNAERESLDAQLNESLAALAAYQSHLDFRQQQLALERDELRAERQQIELDRATAQKNHSESSAALTNELNAAREKVTALTTLLLNRTEELRTLDNRRAEVQTELELSRARERELKSALDENKRAVDQERSQWADELHQLREVVERQLDAPAVEETLAAPSAPAAPAAAVEPIAPSSPPAARPSSGNSAHVIPRENPVLGTIVEQFGKLRQQRAVERHSVNRSR